MEPSELIELAMKRQGIDPKAQDANSQLADVLGYRQYPPAQIGRWRNDKHEPRFAATLLLLSKAGLLLEEPTPLTVDSEIAELVAELVRVSERLAAVTQRRAPPPDAPRRRGGSRSSPAKRR